MPSHSCDVLVGFNPPVPAGMVERAANWAPDAVPSVALPAASVVLLRDSENGLQTYVLHRHAQMPFAASTAVFPGGRLDPVDARGPESIRSNSIQPSTIQPSTIEPNTIEPSTIQRCAIRETAEETGVVLTESDLHPWAHWITPEIEPRRYDTWFFVAAMPEGLQAADISGETDHAEWLAPAEALAAERSGVIKMLPPTLSILIELAGLERVAEVITHAAGRRIEAVLPRLERTTHGWQFRYRQQRASSS